MSNKFQSKQISFTIPKFLSFLSSDLQCIAVLILSFIFTFFTIETSPLSSPTNLISSVSPVAFLNITLLVVAYIIITNLSPEVSNLSPSFLISFISIIMNTFSHNFSLLNLPFCLMVPSLVLWLTKSYLNCIISLFIQLINILLLFRNNIEEAIKIIPTQDLTERLTQCLTLGSIILTFFFAFGFYSKERKEANEVYTFPTKVNNQEKSISFNPDLLLTNFMHEAEACLQNILGSLDLLLRHIEPGLGAKLLKIARVSSEELGRILFNFEELNKGDKQSINNSPICVKSLFKPLWENISLLIQKKGLNGTIKVDGSIPESLELDANKLKFIVSNLVNYLLQFTEKGSITLTVEYAKQILIEDDDCFSDDFDTSTSENPSYNSSLPQSGEISSLFGYFKTITPPKKPKQNTPIEKMLKITIKNFEGSSLKKVEELYSGTEAKDFPYWISDDMTKLSLLISQKACENLGGNLKIYERQNKEVAFVVNIPVGVFEISRFNDRGLNKIW